MIRVWHFVVAAPALFALGWAAGTMIPEASAPVVMVRTAGGASEVTWLGPATTTTTTTTAVRAPAAASAPATPRPRPVIVKPTVTTAHRSGAEHLAYMAEMRAIEREREYLEREPRTAEVWAEHHARIDRVIAKGNKCMSERALSKFCRDMLGGPAVTTAGASWTLPGG